MKRILLLLLLLLPNQSSAFDFTLHQQQGKQAGPTLLVIGGIQGDEPGGFNAAALLATRYQIEKGSLWVVPNLNFQSIIKRSRGLHGDMNRKFATLPSTDPQYNQVARIKKIITDSQVDLVFNLHDGSGFYSPTPVDRLRNPQRWGQSCIIDQTELTDVPFGKLEQLSQAAIARINTQAIQEEHFFHLKNTRTGETDSEMKQALTYFALRHHKPAFGIEVSKSFPTHLRAYYHLVALEAYMQQLGVRFSRDFPLTPESVHRALHKDILISFGAGRIQLELNNLRSTLRYFPLPKNGELQVESNNPLVAVIPYRNRYRIHYGNNRLSFLKPQYFDYDTSLSEIELLVDGQQLKVPFGSRIAVDKEFQVQAPEGYRVNVIGFRKAGQRNESGIRIIRKQIAKNFSIDKSGEIFRVEVYRQNKFSGMVLVDFSQRGKGPLLSMLHHPSTSED
jgi:hypothetical protein